MLLYLFVYNRTRVLACSVAGRSTLAKVSIGTDMVVSGLYSSAKELFIAAGQAAQEAAHIELALEQAKTRELPHAQSYEQRIKTGHVTDALLPTDMRIQLEEKKREILAQDKALVEYAYSILYGTQTTSGLSELIDIQTCEIVEHKFIHNMKWIAISAMFNISIMSARRAVDVAFDIIDSLGFEQTRQGIGQATLEFEEA